MDDSDSGTDPNSDNPGEPGDMGTPDDPTPLSIPDIRTTKALSADPINNGDGTFTLPFTLTLENTGTVDLTSPSIVDDLATELGTGVLVSVDTIVLDTIGRHRRNGSGPECGLGWDGRLEHSGWQRNVGSRRFGNRHVQCHRGWHDVGWQRTD